MRGTLQWPLFALLMPIDGVILHLLPPSGRGINLIPALIVSSFSNLFLIGLVAPWFARRLIERQARATAGLAPLEPTTPPAVLSDRVASITLVIAAVGVLALGLGSRPVVVSETARTEQLGQLVSEYVARHGSPEVKRNLEAANTHNTREEGFFRTCVPLDDRTKAYCMFVDVPQRKVALDSDANPNAVYFGEVPR